jgi:hypothetical protein
MCIACIVKDSSVKSHGGGKKCKGWDESSTFVHDCTVSVKISKKKKSHGGVCIGIWLQLQDKQKVYCAKVRVYSHERKPELRKRTSTNGATETRQIFLSERINQLFLLGNCVHVPGFAPERLPSLQGPN